MSPQPMETPEMSTSVYSSSPARSLPPNTPSSSTFPVCQPTFSEAHHHHHHPFDKRSKQSVQYDQESAPLAGLGMGDVGYSFLGLQTQRVPPQQHFPHERQWQHQRSTSSTDNSSPNRHRPYHHSPSKSHPTNQLLPSVSISASHSASSLRSPVDRPTVFPTSHSSPDIHRHTSTVPSSPSTPVLDPSDRQTRSRSPSARMHLEGSTGSSSPLKRKDGVRERDPSPLPMRSTSERSLIRTAGTEEDEESAFEDEEIDELEEDEEDDADEAVLAASLPSQTDVALLEDALSELNTEFGLGEDEEEGDDESREMRGVRDIYGLVQPLMPALRSMPTWRSQMMEQAETIRSLRRVIDVQAELGRLAMEEDRAIQKVHQSNWETEALSMISKASRSTGSSLAPFSSSIDTTQPCPSTSAASSTELGSSKKTSSGKESGFSKIESNGQEDYENLLRQWVELQAEHRKSTAERTTMRYSLRDAEAQIQLLTKELYFLRASALHGRRPIPSSQSTTTAPPTTTTADKVHYTPEESTAHPPLPSTARAINATNAHASVNPGSGPSSGGNSTASTKRHTLGDARSEHLLLAARRLRTLRAKDPEIGLIRTEDYVTNRLEAPTVDRNGNRVIREGAGAAGEDGWAMEDELDGWLGISTGGRQDKTPRTLGRSRAGNNKGKKLTGAALSTPSTAPRATTATSGGRTTGTPLEPSTEPAIEAISFSTSTNTQPRDLNGTPKARRDLFTPRSTGPPSGATFDDLLMAAHTLSQSSTTESGITIAECKALGSPKPNESPKRRRVQTTHGSSASVYPGEWVHGSPGGGGSKGGTHHKSHSMDGMHASALDLLALATYLPGSDDHQSSSSSGGGSPLHASIRLGGLLGSSSGSEARPNGECTQYQSNHLRRGDEQEEESTQRQDQSRMSSLRSGSIESTPSSNSSHQSSSPNSQAILEPAFQFRPDRPTELTPHPPHTTTTPRFLPYQTPTQLSHLVNSSPGGIASSPVMRQRDDRHVALSAVPRRVRDEQAESSEDGEDEEDTEVEGNVIKSGSSRMQTQTQQHVPMSPSLIDAKNEKAGESTALGMPAKRVRSPYLKWSIREDELLARGVAKYGQKWDLVSKTVPTRSYHQCRQRWLRKLGVFDNKPSPSQVTHTSLSDAQEPLGLASRKGRIPKTATAA